MQNDPILVIPSEWDFLEPTQDPSYARTDHVVLKKADVGQVLVYPAGQALLQKSNGVNEFAKLGTVGYDGPPRILKYPVAIDDQGRMQIGNSFMAGRPTHKGSVDAYYRGYFKVTDIKGLAAGATNEVQTETVTASGGTRTITVTKDGDSQTTSALAYNANAAAIQAALEALSNVEPGDIVVTGTGPYVYTFGGNFADQNVPAMVVNTGSLTGGSSSFAETTPGTSDNLNKVGNLIRGSRSAGIVEIAFRAIG